MDRANDMSPSTAEISRANKVLVLALCAVPAVYLLAAAVGVHLKDQASAANLSWCATSVLLGALLRSSGRTWLPLTAAAAAGELAAYWMMGRSPVAASGVVFADMIEICIAAAAVRHLTRGKTWYLSLKTVFSLCLVSLIASSASTLCEFYWTATFAHTEFQPFAKVRSFTDALNLLVALPFVLSWTDSSLLRRLTARKIAGIAVLTAASAATSYLLLVSGTAFLFLTIPILLLATLFGGILGSTAAVYGLSLVVRWFTLGGQTEAISLGGTEATESLVIFHLFVFTALLSSIPLGVLLGQLESSAEQLREAGKAADHARQEAEAARDKAEQAGRAKSDFLSVMSHELRTPMTGVLGLVDLLSKEEITNHQRHYLDSMRTSGRHLLEIINDILDFSKLETGKLEVECTGFSIKSVFESICATTRPLCRTKNIEFNDDYSGSIPEFVLGDPTRIRQILLNLIGNAIKFTDRGLVKVAVSHYQVNETAIWLRFEVQDTGIGIAYEKQAEIFGAFTQADRSTARRYGGSGLGLAISKRLAEAMGGEIGFTSTPGFGSIFYFEVPVLRSNREDIVPVDRDAAKELPPCRILVAEDIALNRSIIRSMLSMNRHTLVFAQNGAEAVEWAKCGHFDVILMDVQMPVMDGVEATRQIRRLGSPARNTPIIALTANVLEKERQRYLEAGMNVCIPKPIDWNDLNDAIAQCITEGQTFVSDHADPVEPISAQSAIVDTSKLKALRAKLDREVPSLLRQAIEYAEHTCEQLKSSAFELEHFSREMHALKGMAGMLGLTGIQRISGELEAGAGIDGSLESYEAELREIIIATRAALIQINCLPAGELTF